jgi:DSF synthase
MLEALQYRNLSIYGDANGEALYVSMNVQPRPCMTWSVIQDFLHFQSQFVKAIRSDAQRPRCLVYSSQTPGIFSLGGDLRLFQAATASQDRAGLTRYIEDCASALHNLASTPDTVTISLLEGDALGAGLETALASDVVIAERGIRSGFPEALFNLIPGAGGYFLLARRIGPTAAERIIREGAVHDSEELYARGLVDILVDKGEGRHAVRDLLSSQARSWNSFKALQLVKRCHSPITRALLSANAEIWVNAVMNLTDRDRRLMKRLIQAQEKRAGSAVQPSVPTVDFSQRAAA